MAGWYWPAGLFTLLACHVPGAFRLPLSSICLSSFRSRYSTIILLTRALYASGGGVIWLGQTPGASSTVLAKLPTDREPVVAFLTASGVQPLKHLYTVVLQVVSRHVGT